MTTLPIPSGWPDPVLPGRPSTIQKKDGFERDCLAAASDLAVASDDEKFLLRAFRSFAEAAGSLERSYAQLRGEVERLRCELEGTNRDLAQSLEQNRGMRAYLDRILEGLPCGVLVVSSAGEISRVNPEALRLLGFAPEMGATIGTKIETTKETTAADATAAPLSLSSLPSAICNLLEQARQRDIEQEFRTGLLNTCAPNTSSLNPGVDWIAVRHALITDNGNQSSVFILRDVSGRKTLEEAQARMRREQALAEMSAILAHEIRNPLGSLELFAGLLAESELDGERQGWVERLQSGLRTLSATVNNVLHFHRVPEPDRAAVDLGELLDWARDFFAPLTRESRITLSTQNRLHGISLSADRHRLEQVLANLVLNAVHVMPGGGWIEIAGTVHRNQVHRDQSISIAIADTGPGVRPEHLPHLFEPGFSTRAAGPGLGLAVCRKIVEQHGGEINATSPPERGAVFTLTFPLSAKFAADPATKHKTAEFQTPETKTSETKPSETQTFETKTGDAA